MACRRRSAAPLKGPPPPWAWFAPLSYGLAMLELAVVLPSQLRWLRALAALGLLDDALDEVAVRVVVGLPSGLGANGMMLMVESVGIALADLCETCPGRRPGERGGFKGGSCESRRRFLSDCLVSRE